MQTTSKNNDRLFRAFQGERPPMSRVKAGRAALERRLEADFRAHLALRKERLKVDAVLHAPLQKMLSESHDTAKLHKTMRQMARSHKRQSLKMPVRTKVQKSARTGSLHVVIPPPYWAWQWEQTDGGAFATIGVDGNAGTMNLWAQGTNSDYTAGGDVWARAAVGTWFQPPEVGLLTISASPSLIFDWWADSLFSGGHTDGWLGLYVSQYELNGTATGTVNVDQQIYLWNDNCYFGQDTNNGSNTGFALNSGFFAVSPDFFYELWVWCGLDDDAYGWNGGPWGSDAQGSLNITTPAFTLDLFN